MRFISLWLFLFGQLTLANDTALRESAKSWFDEVQQFRKREVVESILKAKSAFSLQTGSDFGSIRTHLDCLAGPPVPKNMTIEEKLAWARKPIEKPDCDGVGLKSLGYAEVTTVWDIGRLCRTEVKTEDQLNACKDFFNKVSVAIATKGAVLRYEPACLESPVIFLAREQKSGRAHQVRSSGLTATVISCDTPNLKSITMKAEHIRQAGFMGYCMQFTGKIGDKFYAGGILLGSDGYVNRVDMYDPNQTTMGTFEYRPEVLTEIQTSGGKSALGQLGASSLKLPIKIDTQIDQTPEGDRAFVSALKELVKQTRDHLKCPVFMDSYAPTAAKPAGAPAPAPAGAPASR